MKNMTWNGDQIRDRAIAAAEWGVDATTSACVRAAAKRLYPGHGYDHGVLRRSIQMRPAQRVRKYVVGLWGSFDVLYAIYVEKGTAPHWIGAAVKIKGVGWRYIGMHPGTRPMPYLIPSADEEYPKLHGRIRKAFARGA